jgi:hypothetical protein
MPGGLLPNLRPESGVLISIDQRLLRMPRRNRRALGLQLLLWIMLGSGVWISVFFPAVLYTKRQEDPGLRNV